jgi:hypothetical protein
MRWCQAVGQCANAAVKQLCCDIVGQLASTVGSGAETQWARELMDK